MKFGARVLTVLCLLLSLGLAARAETIWESFDGSPFVGGPWQKIGSSCEFTYHDDGYMQARLFRTAEVNRFVRPLEQTYDEGTEFWWEWDWRAITIYDWPRAHFGMFNSAKDNEHSMLAEWFARRESANAREGSRIVGRADDGTTIYWTYAELYPRLANETLDLRTRLHYYTNPWGEGVIHAHVLNLRTGQVLFSGEGKVLDPGKSLTVDLFGIACLDGDADSPTMRNIVWFDNLYFSTEQDGDSYFASLGIERPVPSWDADYQAPSPNPMGWAEEPVAVSPTTVRMRAATARDPSGVQYYFQNITDPAHDSGWQDSPEYIDTGLKDATEYVYRVKARDLSHHRNETEWSEPKRVNTPVETDNNPPMPNPPVWAQKPYVFDRNSIYMEVEPVRDPEGREPIEYYFLSLNDPAYDSGWQRETAYLITHAAYDTEYAFAVLARDGSANRNETALSEVVAVRTEEALPIEAFLRKRFDWYDQRLDMRVPVRIYYKNEATGPDGAPVIVYVMNYGGPRMGREPDGPILRDLLDEGYIVITLDYNNEPKAVSPVLEWSIYDLRVQIEGRQRDTIFAGTGLRTQGTDVYVLPAGYRIARDLVFFELDKHGSYGTVERVMRIYNESRDFLGSPVASADQMVCHDGRPLDWRLKMDIIYPSDPEKPVPLVFWAATSTYRTGALREQGGLTRPHFAGFTLRGYVFANIDHTYNPMALAGCYPHFTDGGAAVLDEWNGLKATTAAMRFLRAHAEQYSIDPRYFGGVGFSKGALSVARVANPDHYNQQEWYRFSGYPEGTPEPQPWPGYPSDITVAYLGAGAGTRRHEQLVGYDNVPTVLSVGERDPFNHAEYWDELVANYERHDVPHLALYMPELSHTLPYGWDNELGIDRYAAMLDFFDQYLKVEEGIPPKLLYSIPYAGKEGVEERSPVTLVFAPYMDRDSVLNGVRIMKHADGKVLDGTWEVSLRGTKFIWTPATPYERGETYVIEIQSTVRDVYGRPMEPVTIHFTVER